MKSIESAIKVIRRASIFYTPYICICYLIYNLYRQSSHMNCVWVYFHQIIW